MTSESEAILTQFKKDLNSLKDNDKYKINALTFCARDYKSIVGVPEGIVAATSAHVLAIPSGLKLLGLYVIDSIVKNVASPYRKLYTKNIVDLFVHAFQAIRDENGRIKLFNLRSTWKEIFPNEKMHSLDLMVRKQDPAWPLLVTAESKPVPKALPSVPKVSKTKPIDSESKTTSEDSSSPQTPQTNEAVIAPSRDPRINRKRKSPEEVIESQFLIDRDGDSKMESVARKQGKKDEVKQVLKKPNALTLFSGKDQDMRPPQMAHSNARPLPSPARNHIWSSYFDKNSELCSRRESQDIDMRFGCSNMSAENTAPISSSTTGPLSSSPNMSGNSLTYTNALPAPSPAPLPSQVSFVDNPQVPTQDNFMPHREPVTHFQPPFRYPARGADLGRSGPVPPPPPPFHRRRDFPRSGPPIRGPVWSVEIDGFPDMIDIGVDPRMLSLVPTPKHPRQITIDDRQYPLILDRVQPLIKVDDHFHAVRFRCEYLTVIIDNRTFTIPGTGYTRIFAASKERIAYLGGPGHEIIIDGKPHTIPFNSHLTYINVDRQTVSVKFAGEFPQNINVLPAIAPKLLDWAAQGLFGPASSLNLAPLNPLNELTRLATGPKQEEARPAPEPSPPKLEAVEAKPPVSQTPPTSQPQPTLSEPAPIALPSLDVHELFQKLVAAGIVSRPVDSSEPPMVEAPPDIQEYAWEKFRVPFPHEIDALYSGYQCVQCGVRFEDEGSPDFAKHLDYHYVKNSAEHRDRQSRTYYQSYHYWLMSEMSRDGAPQFKDTVEVEEEEPKCPAFTDPALNVCAVCFEKFDPFWDQDEEEWMLRGAVLVGDKVYHPICQEDVGKNFNAERSTEKGEQPTEPTHGSLSDDQNVPPPPPPESPHTAVSVKHEQIDNNSDFDSQTPLTARAQPHRTASLPSLSTLVPLKEEETPVFHSPTYKREDETSSKCVIPGLSPAQSPSSADVDNADKADESKDAVMSNRLETVGLPAAQVGNTSLGESFVDISANPLEALNAVLRGNTSILTQSLGMR
ncbi:hypothetical protein AAHC03_05390 [Spirometra sp. Aus1]